MNEIAEKLNTLKEKIIKEKTEGKLRFLGMLARADIEGKWDIVISADWIEKNSNEQDFIYVIKKLKEVFGTKLEFIARIVLLTTKEFFIKQLVLVLIAEKYVFGEELSDFKIPALEVSLKKIIVIFYDFSGIDLQKETKDEEGEVAFKKLDEF